MVASLNRPGGNLTAKRFELLHDLAPNSKALALLVDSTISTAPFQVEQVQVAGRKIGVPIQIVSIGADRDYLGAFAAVARENVGAMLVAASSKFNAARIELAELAIRHGIPTMFEIREFVEAGGVMSYAPSVLVAFRQVRSYVGRILKGETPAKCPVMFPSKFKLVLNLNAAKALGINIPPMLLARADEVIE